MNPVRSSIIESNPSVKSEGEVSTRVKTSNGVRVKICGITNEEDARWAANLGTDFLGFNFYRKSPRKISVKLASEIIAKIPSWVEGVGVFVNAKINEALKIAAKTNLKIVQLHGNESPRYCAMLKSKNPDLAIIKAIKIRNEDSLQNLSPYKKVDFFLLDTWVEDKEGGTGQTFNWELARKAKEVGKPIFLSGGLNPENVAEAVEKVKPFGVDVASGVERLPRRKDYEKLKKFITQAKQ